MILIFKNVCMKVIMDEFHFRRVVGIVLAGSPARWVWDTGFAGRDCYWGV